MHTLEQKKKKKEQKNKPVHTCADVHGNSVTLETANVSKQLIHIMMEHPRLAICNICFLEFCFFFFLMEWSRKERNLISLTTFGQPLKQNGLEVLHVERHTR